MIEPEHPEVSIRRQCELVGLNRSTYYYKQVPESELNLFLMRLIDQQYMKTPFYGWPRMTAHLCRQGYKVNHKRVQRLMSKMGLQAVYPKRQTSIPAKGHKVYPYLLRNLTITHPNQVWSTDITYIPMRHGFMYLVAVIDWYRDSQPSLTRTKAHSSPRSRSHHDWKRQASGLAWTVADVHWTTSLWNGSGGRSSTSTSICTSTRQYPSWERAWVSTLCSTITSVCIRVYRTRLLRRSILRAFLPNNGTGVSLILATSWSRQRGQP